MKIEVIDDSGNVLFSKEWSDSALLEAVMSLLRPVAAADAPPSVDPAPTATEPTADPVAAAEAPQTEPAPEPPMPIDNTGS
jgi:hypothetical protein